MTLPLSQLVASFFLTLALIIVLAPMTRGLGLTDKPSARKLHQGNIPLTGGIALFLTLTALLFVFLKPTSTHLAWLLGAGLLVIAGALDDRFNLPLLPRVIIELLAAAIMVFGAGLWVEDLGNLLGTGNLSLPFWLGMPVTLIAVFGIINAINMIDGMDGLASGVCLLALGVLLAVTGPSASLGGLELLLMGGLLAFMFCNISGGRYLPKVFLGDAGSNLLGFTLVWLVIETTSTDKSISQRLEPATALYLVGLPLIDMVTTTLRRVRKGKSPFHPDRTHIHHILQRSGFSHGGALVLILVLSLTINLIGVTLQKLGAPAWLLFLVFIGLFVLYSYNIHHAWKLSKRLRPLSGRAVGARRAD